MKPPHSRGQMDALARSRGFPNYETWVAWNRNRQVNLQAPGPGVAVQQPTNFLQTLAGKIPIHPTYLLNYVNDKFKQATGG